MKIILTHEVSGLGAAGDVLPVIPAVAPFTSFVKDPPDPTDPFYGYTPGQLARMCVAQTGSTAVGGSPSLVQFWHKITDYVDGAISWGAD